MTTHAASEDCPCCHECLSPGLDTDRALVSAFLGGVAVRDHNIPMGSVLCGKHAAMMRECLEFVLAHAREAANPS